MPVIGQSDFLQALGWAVLNSLWQMALLWVIYQVILSFNSSIRPGRKAGIATAFVIAGFVWFIFTFISIYFSSHTANPISSFAQVMFDESTWNTWIEKTLPLASAIYLLLLAIPLWQFIRNYRYVQLLRRRGLSRINPEWRMFVKKLSARMGIKKNVMVWLSDMIESPVTIGYLKPIILIPVAAINSLSIQQVEAVLLHELSHIRRYDYLFNLIINFIKTILYFNPFVRLFIDCIEKERENSCDELVIQFQYKPVEYASALLILEKAGVNRHEMMMAASGPGNNLLQRIENILGIQKRKMFSFRRFTGAIAIFLSVIVINAFLFINEQTEGKVFFGLNNSYNPYYFMMDGSEQPLEEVQVSPSKPVRIEKQKVSQKTNYAYQIKKGNPEPEEMASPELIAPGFYNVNYFEPVIPELNVEEEENLQEAVAATKKVLQEKEWKEIEKSYAEVLNSTQKAKLRNEYKKEINNVDWNKLEEKLRLSYNSLDWEKINGQLNSSLAQITIDSIKVAITLAIKDLNKLETWMKENNTSCIPDSDITLQSIKETQRKAQVQLNKVKAIKHKKIVRI